MAANPMSAAPRRERRDGAATRERILREALRLFAQRGVDGVPVRDIAAAVGVADAALYRHFSSKEDLAAAIFREHYGALAQAITQAARVHEPDFPALMHALVDLLCALFDHTPDVFAFILIHQHDHLRLIGHGDNVVAELSAIMRRARLRGDIAIEDPDLAAAIALGAAVQPAVFRIYGRLAGPLSSRREVLASAILKALGARSATP